MNPAEYEIMYRVETEHWWYRNLHALVDSALKGNLQSSEGLVLDAGCGTGAVVSRLSPTYKTVGLDFSPLALHFTRQRALLPLVRGSVSCLPFADASFDAVVSLDVVSHAGAGPPQKSIAELARVTRPGGSVVLNVPAYSWLRSPHDVQVQTGYRFARPQLAELMRESGLTVTYCTHWNSLLMPAVVAARLFKRITGSTSSDLAEYRPGIGAAVCSGALRIERVLLRFAAIPFGVSIFAVARKPE